MKCKISPLLVLVSLFCCVSSSPYITRAEIDAILEEFKDKLLAEVQMRYEGKTLLPKAPEYLL